MTSCSEKILKPGIYEQTLRDGSFNSEYEQYRFNSDKTFEYYYFHDDIGQSKYGIGNYSISGNELLLEFNNDFIELSRVRLIEISIDDNSNYRLQFYVQGMSGAKLLGANIQITNLDNEIIASTVADRQGYAEISLSDMIVPILVKVSVIGYQDLVYQINNQESIQLEIKLMEDYGAIIKNERFSRTIKIQRKSILIENKEFVKTTVANNA
ncbi:MAG: carboxypeptidase-like regulatory domain-containing protein [Candidatus Shapirobacteria bacterium]